MSHTWKLLPLAAVFALGLVVLLPGNGMSVEPTTASAAIDCGTTHRLTVNIRDTDTGANITVDGAEVRISPNPISDSGTGSRVYVDNGTNDDSDNVGQIQESSACEVTDSGGSPTAYTISLESLPDELADCDFVDDTVTTTLTANRSETLTVANCPDLTPTATATTSVTPTTTVGPASAVTVSASPASLGCNGTSIVTIQVKDASGNAVAAGTSVTLTASTGTLNPPNGTTANDGSLFVFYSAPASNGGTATITATAGSKSGTGTITVNCNTAPTATTAPPPTVAPTVSTGGVISPPNTGDAGLASSDNGIGWQTYGGIALVIASTLGALVLVRSRVRD